MIVQASQKTFAAKGMLLLALGLLLLSQFSATTHELAVLHARCVQHGELVELNGSGAATDAPPAAQTPEFVAADGATSTQHHQHCPLLSSRVGNQIFRLQPVHSVELPVSGERTHRSLADVAQVRLTVYLNAPKHSPPAA